ncbi:hypothetical protein AB833_24450 [Chromatiales bacterium (ex Bugula neritina AB1)]|nr:hypothetical protein AB833_24450 [Chromatiales bacterium (ex Bugula neritina AB1)]
MALGSTIHKVSLNIADMTRHYYQQHELTVAVHPSENDLRFMVRLIAFALNATEQLAFTRGIGTDDEPEIQEKNLTNEIQLWIDFGQVDEKRIKKACGRAARVVIYTYHERKAKVWWEQNRQKLRRYKNLSVFHIDAQDAEAMASRNMNLQCSIDDGQLYLSDEFVTVNVPVIAYSE